MHSEALTKKAAELFPRFSQFADFYLVGGTALALHIGHRISVDFDFFSEKELPSGLPQKVRRVFPHISVETTYKEAGQQITLSVDTVKTTFFYYPYPLMEPLLDYQGVSVVSMLEIAAMKAFSIGKRLSYKDYVDWYFLLSEKHVALDAVIALSRKKFNGDFNDRLFLGQLVSISDVPNQKIDFLRDAVDRPTIEEFLAKTVREFEL